MSPPMSFAEAAAWVGVIFVASLLAEIAAGIALRGLDAWRRARELTALRRRRGG